MSRTLYGLSQSPWTERARWALAHHRVSYTYHEHVPMLGEVLLRWKAGTKKASVPLLADGERVVMGSAEIGRHVDTLGAGASLFPEEDAEGLERWIGVAERLMRAARDYVLPKLAADPAARAELLPPFLPGAVRRALGPMARTGVGFLRRKYDSGKDAAELQREIRTLLREAEDGVRGRPYVLSTFSFADIALATCTQILRPRPYEGVPAPLLAAWGNEELARAFPDLLAWREELYAKHR